MSIDCQFCLINRCENQEHRTMADLFVEGLGQHRSVIHLCEDCWNKMRARRPELETSEEE